MASRITEKDLRNMCERINDAYGGVCLHQMCNESGGVRTVSTGGYSTKRELYEQMCTFLAGLEYDKGNK